MFHDGWSRQCALPETLRTCCWHADGLRQVVRWGERRGYASRPDRSTRLKFELRDARLYGSCFTEAKA